MNKEDIHSVKQYELFGPGIFIPNFELIERGMEAEMVVKMLFDTHQVKRFSCIEFDPNAPIRLMPTSHIRGKNGEGQEILKNYQDVYTTDHWSFLNLKAKIFIFTRYWVLGRRSR